LEKKNGRYKYFVLEGRLRRPRGAGQRPAPKTTRRVIKIDKEYFLQKIQYKRMKKSERYGKEQEEIGNKIIEILKLDEKQTFLLCDLDEDLEKQQAILGLKDDIQKYFAVSSMTAFHNDRKTKRDYLIIVKGILKQLGYVMEKRDYTLKIEGKGMYKRTIQYKIFKEEISEKI
jgi:hypothetical protein